MSPVVRHHFGSRIVLETDAALEAQATFALDAIVAALGEAAPRDRATIDFGWTRLTLVRRGTDLIVHEPDFLADAMTGTRPGARTSLAIVARQVALLRLVGADAQATSFRDTFVFVPSSLGERRVYQERARDVDRGDSGWFVGPVDREAEKNAMTAKTTAELVRLRHALLDVLLLPAGHLVVWNGDEIEAVVDAEERNLWTPDMTAARARWPTIFG